MLLRKILIAQTAFIGDVILATPLIEKLHKYYPEARIDFLVRKGNESLLRGHPKLNRVYVWDKQGAKYQNLWQLAAQFRAEKYDLMVNLQRFASSGIFTLLSGAKMTLGFDKNPFSFLFTRSFPHRIGQGQHEVERNLSLIAHLTDERKQQPKLYPTQEDFDKTAALKKLPYLCLAPTSVWFTKQLAEIKWIEFLQKTGFEGNIYLLGAPSDKAACERIAQAAQRPHIINLAGQLNLLQSAALMQDAVMNYVNDSAPMHLASSVNAPTCAIFCSTVPAFGFTPLSDIAQVVEVEELACRPCGLHGHKQCPKGHFKCAQNINIAHLEAVITS